MTDGGPDPDKECVLPFSFSEIYNLQEWKDYNTCALDHIGRPWCPTKLGSNGRFFSGGFIDDTTNQTTDPIISTNWGYCGKNCPLPDLPAGNIQM